MPRPKHIRRSIAVIILVLIVVAIGLNLDRMAIRSNLDEQQCRLRLRRLGIAVNMWVMDRGFERFPNIANPQPGAAFDPQRPASARAFLHPYLRGDIFLRQRENEDREAFQERQLRQEMTVDPRTDLEFWYNPQLAQFRPDEIPALTDDQDGVWYFRSQRDNEGQWPYRRAGSDGSWMVYGGTIRQQYSQADINDLRQRLNEIERRNQGVPEAQWSHDLHYLRREVDRIEQAHRTYGELSPDGSRVLIKMALEERVRFTPGDQIPQW
ncbi:MAG: hypothetical protein EA401_05855 [Planctomycetota bacterium]|nr:MAG: hypothetical protein EA401_05855 [Planctomycetota bacterium]